MINIRRGTHADSDALIKLTGLCPMKGIISLRIDREPDFFLLLQERGDYWVLVAEEKNRIIGSLSVACQNTFIKGKAAPVYYLGDLKVHPDFSKSLAAYRLLREMHTQLSAIHADMVLCTAAFGNDAVMSFFKGRASLPAFTEVTTFSVFQILPGKIKGMSGQVCNFDEARLMAFYEDVYAKYAYRPAIHLSRCNHFVYAEEGIMRAAVSTFDAAPLKQNIVLNYPASIAFMLNILRKLGPLLGLSQIPRKNESLRILYVKHFGFAEGFEKSFLTLINQVRNYGFEKGYHLISIAIDEKDKALTGLIKRKSQVVFRSVALLASLNNNKCVVDEICKGLCFEDYSLV
jgi:hypothetical protein